MQESQLIFDGLKCRVALHALEPGPASFTYTITGQKGGAPGMAPACDGLWGATLVVSAQQADALSARIPQREKEPALLLRRAEAPAGTR